MDSTNLKRRTLNMENITNAAGATGGILSVNVANILGVISFNGALETAVYALVGGVVGYYTVKGIKWFEKKCGIKNSK